MSVVSIIKGVVSALPLVPKIARVVGQAIAKRPLDPPLGESEAARAIRLEEERRAAEAAKRAEKG